MNTYPTGFPTSFEGAFSSPKFGGAHTPANWMAAPSSALWTPNPFAEFGRTMNFFEHELAMREGAARAAMAAAHKPYSVELCSFPSRPTSLLEHYSFLNPIRIDVNGNRWLNCCFDLRTFKPEEIKVTVSTVERCIHVEAQHEVKDSKEHYIRRQYNRKFFMPEDLKIDLGKLEPKSYLTTEGLLYFEAALPKQTTEELAKMSETAAVTHPYGTHFGFMPITTIPVPVKHI